MECLSEETKTGKERRRVEGKSHLPMVLAMGLLFGTIPFSPSAMAKFKKPSQKPVIVKEKIHWNDPDWWQASWAAETNDPDQDRQSLYNLLRIVKSTKFGRKVIKIAFDRYPKFYERISIGDRSFTESTYSRTYSLKDGSEELMIENHLTISRNLSRIDAVYDLTHELVHFLFRKPHNPYKMEFSMPEFVRHGIEGKGGELQAFEAECRLAWELEKKAKVEPHRLCEKYRLAIREKEQPKRSLASRILSLFARDKAAKDFYSVGNYFVTLQGLQIELPKLSNENPIFISSLENSPYPYALIQEFVNVRKMACENNVRKARLIQQQAARARDGRDPTADANSLSKEYKRLSKYFRRHCQTDIAK